MHTETRSGPIDRIYLHTNEGPQGPGAASNLAHYLENNGANGGGYHVVVDDQSTVEVAPDWLVTWGEGGDNQRALSICLIGYAGKTDWSTPYSRAMIERAAQQVAAWCKKYRIPVVHVRPGAPGQAPTDRGIAEHADDHDPSSEGHTDPGSAFPITAFVARVKQLVQPADLSTSPAFIAWKDRVSAKPLHAGEDSADAAIMNVLLSLRGYPHNTTDHYGSISVTGVAALKRARGLVPADGTVFGDQAAAAILKP